MRSIGLWEEAWVLSDLLISFCITGTQPVTVTECPPVQDPQGHVLLTKEGTHLGEL